MSTIDACFRARRGDFSLDVNLQLPDAGFTALFGPSGCGKTTLLRALAGLGRCNGYLCFGDAIWQDDAAGRWLPVEHRPIAYVFQEASLFPHLSVRGNLNFGYKRIPKARRRIAFDAAVAWLGLEGLLDRNPAGLSGGERQRVAIARALLTSPDLLLMDEPLSALDAHAKAAIFPYLERLHRELKMPVVYVTHAVDEVARLADFIVQMEAGRVMAQGSAIELLSSLEHRPIEGEEPGAVVEAMIRQHDDEHYLSELILSGGQTLLAPRLSASAGSPVRVRIPAREVSISLNVPEGTSILNILTAHIADFSEGDPGRVLVLLELAGELEGELERESGQGEPVRLLSRISRYSWDRLNLKSGMTVQAQIKSMGLAHK